MGKLPNTTPVPPFPSRNTGARGGPLPSREDVGWQVVDEPVVRLRQQPARFVVEATVAGAGGVAPEGAAGHRRHPEVVDAAAMDAGGVVGEGAVAHRQRGGEHATITTHEGGWVENAAAIG